MATNLIERGRVLLIGASGTDIVGRCQHTPIHATSNPAVIRHSFGGVARNVAENLAHLGLQVSLITAVGDDSSGKLLLEHAGRAGIDTSAVLVVPGGVTSTYMGIMDDQGQMHIAADDMRVLERLSSQHLHTHASLFRNCGLLFVDANLQPATLRTAISLAKKAHLAICADPTSANLAARLKPYLENLHLITANAYEAAVLTGEPLEGNVEMAGLGAARRLVAMGAEIALVTLGEYGVCYASSETSGRIPALRTTIQDPTGAGNALTAVAIFALLNEISLDDAVRLGVSAATLTLRHSGAVVPDLSLDKLYDQLVI